MPLTDTDTHDVEAALRDGGTEAALDLLIERLRGQKKHHDLFEALKMRLRHRLGLPVHYHDSGDELDAERRDALEEGLLEACREVGNLLLVNGMIQDGWMYLRPVGDKASVAAALAELEVDEDNLEDFVNVALHEGVDPARGFAMVLEHYGTCNAITTFEQNIAYQRTPDEQQAAASQLLAHLHQELLSSVQADIAQQEGAAPSEQKLSELIADREWLFTDHSYHVDTTHLSSTVRFARLLDDPEQLLVALDLTDYGRCLSEQFQYPGDEPFTDFYPAHALFFHALRGEQVDDAVAYFREKADTVDADEQGTMSIEVYLHLLARVNRFDEAIAESLRLLTEDRQRYASGLAPTLLELSQASGNFEPLLAQCRQQDNLLGYTTALLMTKD